MRLWIGALGILQFCLIVALARSVGFAIATAREFMHDVHEEDVEFIFHTLAARVKLVFD